MAVTQLVEIDQEGPTLVVRFLEAINAFDDEVFERWPYEWDRLKERIEDDGVHHLIVDFSELEYFGSIMLKRLFKMWKMIGKKQSDDGQPHQMAICAVSDVGQEILQVAGFQKLCPTYPDRAAALAAIHA